MMIAAHNLLANFSQRELNINTGKQDKNIEKLSSGYRINRGSDDAAGLAISEKMRKQIRGLDRGATNITDGISLVQTAEGALAEVHDVLQRMRELSIQAYNGTNSQSDREAIQLEIDQLLTEIDRTAESTKFNEIYCLKGGEIEMKTGIVDGGVIETSVTKSMELTKQVPEWLISSTATMAVNSSFSTLQKGNDVGYCLFKVDKTDPQGATINADYVVVGPPGWSMGSKTFNQLTGRYANPEPSVTMIPGMQWSNNLGDNVSATFSFEHISQQTDPESLYGSMVDLLGTMFGAPCGTCRDEFYGLSLYGSAQGYEATPSYFNTLHDGRMRLYDGAQLNISSLTVDYNGKQTPIYDAAYDLLMRKDRGESVSGTEVQSLADSIAKKLCDASYEKIKQTGLHHYDRALKNGDYDLVIYDYRDSSIVNNSMFEGSDNTDSSILTAAQVTVTYEETETTDRADYEFEYEVRDDKRLNIQGSSDGKDYIPLTLPNISCKKLGINGYNVTITEAASYTYVDERPRRLSIEQYEKDYKAWEDGKDARLAKWLEESGATDKYNEAMDEYNQKMDEYNQKLQEWNEANDAYQQTRQTTRTPKTRTETYQSGTEVTVIKGEVKQKPIYSTREVQYEEVSYYYTGTNPGPRPVPPEMPQSVYDEFEDIPAPVFYDQGIRTGIAQNFPLAHASEINWENEGLGEFGKSPVGPLDTAIQKISEMRSYLGGIQNRLEHAYLNNTNSSENSTAAESRIRDTDMAEAMVMYSATNIMIQAGQSVLAQANQNQQGILSLLGQ